MSGSVVGVALYILEWKTIVGIPDFQSEKSLNVT